MVLSLRKIMVVRTLAFFFTLSFFPKNSVIAVSEMIGCNSSGMRTHAICENNNIQIEKISAGDLRDPEVNVSGNIIFLRQKGPSLKMNSTSVFKVLFITISPKLEMRSYCGEFMRINPANSVYKLEHPISFNMPGLWEIKYTLLDDQDIKIKKFNEICNHLFDNSFIKKTELNSFPVTVLSSVEAAQQRRDQINLKISENSYEIASKALEISQNSSKDSKIIGYGSLAVGISSTIAVIIGVMFEWYRSKVTLKILYRKNQNQIIKIINYSPVSVTISRVGLATNNGDIFLKDSIATGVENLSEIKSLMSVEYPINIVELNKVLNKRKPKYFFVEDMTEKKFPGFLRRFFSRSIKIS